MIYVCNAEKLRSFWRGVRNCALGVTAKKNVGGKIEISCKYFVVHPLCPLLLKAGRFSQDRSF